MLRVPLGQTAVNFLTFLRTHLSWCAGVHRQGDAARHDEAGRPGHSAEDYVAARPGGQERPQDAVPRQRESTYPVCCKATYARKSCVS